MSKLSILGGSPVRLTPMPSKMLGLSLIGEEEMKQLQDVVTEKSPFRHYGIGQPQKTALFEQEAAVLLGSKYTLAVSSGTAALACAMVGLGIGMGDEVILPAFCWYSDYNVLVNVGALPVFADIDDTLTLDPADFQRKITPRTKAVIVVHYQGAAADMDRILAIARKHDILVIEDCAQAFGGEYQGQTLGTLGDIAITSFQSNKMITCGEGGLVFTDNEEYFVRAVRYHDLGFVRPVFEQRLERKELAREQLSLPGMQFRMSELQGAFILAQLRKLPTILTTCRQYHKRIRDACRFEHFSFRPTLDDCGISIFMKFSTGEEAVAFSAALEAEGIPTGPSSHCTNLADRYPIISKVMINPIQPPFGAGFAGEHIVYDSAVVCPNTNDIVNRYIGIGIGPLYTDNDIDDIIQAICKVAEGLYQL
jgi:8-amino-3,8-dideoxy-alpha-D-manno-octulosonate transaminase